MLLQVMLRFAFLRVRGQGQCYSGNGEGKSRKSWDGEQGENEACFSLTCWEDRRDGNGSGSWGPELSSSGRHSQQPPQHSGWFPNNVVETSKEIKQP